MNVILLTILILYQGIIILLDIKDRKKYSNIEITSEEKIKYYKESIIFNTIQFLIVVVFTYFSKWSFEDLGFRSITMSENFILNIVALSISGILLLILFYQTIMVFLSEKHRQAIKEQVELNQNCESTYERVMSQLAIPKTKAEKLWYFFTSLLAGISEETVYRGCLIFLLVNIFPNANLIVIYIITIIIFGIGHSYQGLKGIIKTGVVSILFIMLYISTDSLIPGILLHFISDFSSAFLYSEEKTVQVK